MRVFFLFLFGFVLYIAVIWRGKDVDLRRIKGLKVVLTGGGTGIGRSIADVVTFYGGNILISGRRANKLNETCSIIESKGHPGKCFWVTNDVGALDGAKILIDHASSTLGGVDVIISNHAGGRVARLDEIPEDELYQAFEMTFRPNVFGVMALAKYGFPVLSKSNAFKSPLKPAFIYLSSTSIFYGISRLSLYSGSKAATHPMINSYKQEMQNISWSIMDVGYVATEASDATMPEQTKNTAMPSSVCAEIIASEIFLQRGEVYLPLSYNPIAIPGIFAPIAKTFFPGFFEWLTVWQYGDVNFVLPTQQ